MLPKKIKLESEKENIPPTKKATPVTPLRKGTQAFFWSPGGPQTHGSTPNGNTKIPLAKYRGPSHSSVRYEDNPTLIVDGEQPLDSPEKHVYASQRLNLDAQLINLKARSDEDYRIYRILKAVDQGHFTAATVRLQKCIAQIKTCYKLAPDPEAFLAELNGYIAAGMAYNPFGLQKIYCPKGGYLIKLAQDSSIFQSPIEKSSIIPPVVAAAAAAAVASSPKKPPAVCSGLYDGIPDPVDGDGASPRKARCKARSLLGLFDESAPATTAPQPAASAAEEDLELEAADFLANLP